MMKTGNQKPVDHLIGHMHSAGWSYGHAAYRDTDTGMLVYVADAHKGGQRCVARGETLVGAYIELRSLVAGADRPPP